MFGSGCSKVCYFSNIVSVERSDATVYIVGFVLVATESHYREVCLNQTWLDVGDS